MNTADNTNSAMNTTDTTDNPREDVARMEIPPSYIDMIKNNIEQSIIPSARFLSTQLPVVPNDGLQAKTRTAVPEEHWVERFIEFECENHLLIRHCPRENVPSRLLDWQMVNQQVLELESGNFELVLELPSTRPLELDSVMERLRDTLLAADKKPSMVTLRGSDALCFVKTTKILIELGKWAGTTDWKIELRGWWGVGFVDKDSYLGLYHFGTAMSRGDIAVKRFCIASEDAAACDSFFSYLSGVFGPAKDLEVLCLVSPKPPPEELRLHNEEKQFQTLGSFLGLFGPTKLFGKVPSVLVMGTLLENVGLVNLKYLVAQLTYNCIGQNPPGTIMPLLLLSTLSLEGFDQYGQLLPRIEKEIMPMFGRMVPLQQGGERKIVASRLFVPDNQIENGILEDSETRIYTCVDGNPDVHATTRQRLAQILSFIDKKRIMACGDNRNQLTQNDMNLVLDNFDVQTYAVAFNSGAIRGDIGTLSQQAPAALPEDAVGLAGPNVEVPDLPPIPGVNTLQLLGLFKFAIFTCLLLGLSWEDLVLVVVGCFGLVTMESMFQV